MSYPPITIVMTTFFRPGDAGYDRREAAIETLRSWENLLRYQGERLLHIADDGSAIDYHVCPVGTEWEELTTYSWQKQHGFGASFNAGLKTAFMASPLVFFGVDDWSLTDPFDITPWCQLLLEREDVGMVRLGPPHPGTMGVVEAFTENWQGWGLRLRKDKGFAFGHRPALYHQRIIDAYGWFKEDCSALECEDDYRYKVATITGPDVVLALPHPWQHIDTESLSSMNPGEQNEHIDLGQ